MAPWAPRSLPPLSTCWRPSIRLLQPFFPATISREILMGRRLICPSPSQSGPYSSFSPSWCRTTPEAVTEKMTAAGHVSHPILTRTSTENGPRPFQRPSSVFCLHARLIRGLPGYLHDSLEFGGWTRCILASAPPTIITGRKSMFISTRSVHG